ACARVPATAEVRSTAKTRKDRRIGGNLTESRRDPEAAQGQALGSLNSVLRLIGSSLWPIGAGGGQRPGLLVARRHGAHRALPEARPGGRRTRTAPVQG